MGRVRRCGAQGGEEGGDGAGEGEDWIGALLDADCNDVLLKNS